MSFLFGPILLARDVETAGLAARIAPLLRAGDCLLLEGPIGAGKSTFARALIRARLALPDLEVPSPTFTLVQTYDAGGVEVWHCDLYRLTHPDEAVELGLDAALDEAICLIEWPDRLGSLVPATALTLTFAAGDGGHILHISGPAAWADRLVPALD